jgi:glycosyltransferase involved in cell wall biosynthesis
LRESERGALSFAHHVIVTSAATARLLVAHYDVPEKKISVVRPGVDPVATQRTTKADATPHLLCVAAITPRKGYDVLIAALAALKAHPWRLTIVGEARDPETAAGLQADIARHGLGDRVTLTGAVPAARVAALYAAADVFVLASRFEGYGMVYAEAIAHGLPVIGTNAGAIAGTLAGAGLMVPPDDAAALTDALRRVIGDGALREQLAAGARATKIPTWDDAADEFARALERVTSEATAPVKPISETTTPEATT